MSKSRHLLPKEIDFKVTNNSNREKKQFPSVGPFRREISPLTGFFVLASWKNGPRQIMGLQKPLCMQAICSTSSSLVPQIAITFCLFQLDAKQTGRFHRI
jgi:hypothetical protein